ncbi:MAG: outer membrane protein assembly factor BamD [Terriglobales bacterium]
MHRRLLVSVIGAAMLIGLAACHHSKVKNPIATVDSKQPDKVLFDKAMAAMKDHKYDVARLTLQTLINTYPDSEFLARAKLGVGDSWYAEGGTAALTQAESEYKDFITFFPNMPEAAEAQMKIANIHFDQMEKPDRDFTHAKRAEDEYRAMIQQFPDSKLVPEAKAKLREVQELLAQREFLIGRFYYKRNSWAAAIARLKSVTDTYPLFSDADEALFMLGDSAEKEAAVMRASKLNSARKDLLIKEFENQAAEAYARIVTRYPVMQRAEDARKRLEAMHRPVPTPTPEAIAQNKAEQQGRTGTGMFGSAWGHMHRRPNLGMAAKVGEPTLVDPKQTSATEIVRHANEIIRGSGTQSVKVEKVGTGEPAASEPVPRSEDSAPATIESSSKPESSATQTAAVQSGSAPAPAPTQINELDRPGGGTSTSSAAAATQSSPSSSAPDNKEESSSKAKKKKKLLGVIPY